MQNKFSYRSPLGWLLFGVIVNLLQAYFSPIDADEAYYWVYAQELDWGYFDHPPLVALLIKMGMDWLPGALGLRFGHVLAGGLTALVIWQLLDRPNGKMAVIAALLIAIQPMLQVYGFISTPDGPLLLFSALYLWQYRSFLRQPSWQNSLWLGLIMAALLYSKYHGVILIFFSILPNLRYLLRQPTAWLAVAFGALLYVPHLYWQYAHDFPSFRYHLSGRNDPYQFKYTTEFLLNQLLIFNPFLLYYYVRSLLNTPTKKEKSRPDYRFQQAMKWLILITLGFFLYSTSKGGTEAQWTAMLCIPLIYLLYQQVLVRPAWIPRLRLIGFGALLLFLLVRLVLVAPSSWLPFQKPFDAAPWVKELQILADGRPVIFENSYRDASHYRFYTNNAPAWTFTDVDYRPNQYDIWGHDLAFQDQEVLMVGKEKWTIPGTRPFVFPDKHLYTKVVPDFQVAKFARLSLSKPLPAVLQRGQEVAISVYISLDTSLITAANKDFWNFTGAISTTNSNGITAEDLDLKLNTPDFPLDLYAIFQFVGDGWFYGKLKPLRVESVRGDQTVLLYEGLLKIDPSLPLDELQFQLGLGYPGMPPLRGQSELQSVIIESESN